MRLPRAGTRTRAVFDRLLRGDPAGFVRWRDLKAAYDNALGGYPPDRGQLLNNPRRYSYMTVGRLLQKFAERTARGCYRMRPEWRREADVGTTYEIIKPQVGIDWPTTPPPPAPVVLSTEFPVVKMVREAVTDILSIQETIIGAQERLFVLSRALEEYLRNQRA